MLHVLEAHVAHHDIVLLVATALTRTLLTAQEATSRALQSLDAVNLIAATAQQQQLAAGEVSAQGGLPSVLHSGHQLMASVAHTA